MWNYESFDALVSNYEGQVIRSIDPRRTDTEPKNFYGRIPQKTENKHPEHRTSQKTELSNHKCTSTESTGVQQKKVQKGTPTPKALPDALES